MTTKKTKPKQKKEKKAYRQVKSILRTIERDFRPIRRENLSEKDMERELVAFLRGRYKNLDISYQARTMGGITDVSINGQKIGIELKLDAKPSLDRALAQSKSYAKHFSAVGVVILDTGRMRPEQIEEARRMLNREKNIRAIVIRP